MVNSAEDLCRFCITKDQKLIDLLDNDQSDLANKVETFMKIKCSKDDNLPHKICGTCVYELESFVSFFNRCHGNQKSLDIRFLQRESSASDAENNETVEEPVESDLQFKLRKLLTATKDCDDNRSPSVVPVTDSSSVSRTLLKQISSPLATRLLNRKLNGLDQESSSIESNGSSRERIQNVKNEPGHDSMVKQLIRVVKEENLVEQLVSCKPEISSASVQHPCMQTVSSNGQSVNCAPVINQKSNSQVVPSDDVDHVLILNNTGPVGSLTSQVKNIHSGTSSELNRVIQTFNHNPKSNTNDKYVSNIFDTKSKNNIVQVPSQNASNAVLMLNSADLITLLCGPNPPVINAPSSGTANVITTSAAVLPSNSITLASLLASEPSTYRGSTMLTNDRTAGTGLLQMPSSSVNAKKRGRAPPKKKKRRNSSSLDESDVTLEPRTIKSDHICDICDRGFSRKVKLEQHMKVHRPSNNDDEENESHESSGTESAYSVNSSTDSDSSIKEKKSKREAEAEKPNALSSSSKQAPPVTQSSALVPVSLNMQPVTTVLTAGNTFILPKGFMPLQSVSSSASSASSAVVFMSGLPGKASSVQCSNVSYSNVPAISAYSNKTHPVNWSHVPRPIHSNVPPPTQSNVLPQTHLNVPLQSHPNVPPPTHLNVPPPTHSNVPPPTHSNVPPQTHSNVPPQTHLNVPLQSHSNVPPQTHSIVPPQTHLNVPLQSHSNVPPQMHLNGPLQSHSNVPPQTHLNGPLQSHSNVPPPTHSVPPSTHSDVPPQSHSNVPLQTHSNVPPHTHWNVPPQIYSSIPPLTYSSIAPQTYSIVSSQAHSTVPLYTDLSVLPQNHSDVSPLRMHFNGPPNIHYKVTPRRSQINAPPHSVHSNVPSISTYSNIVPLNVQSSIVSLPTHSNVTPRNFQSSVLKSVLNNASTVQSNVVLKSILNNASTVQSNVLPHPMHSNVLPPNGSPHVPLHSVHSNDSSLPTYLNVLPPGVQSNVPHQSGHTDDPPTSIPSNILSTEASPSGLSISTTLNGSSRLETPIVEDLNMEVEESGDSDDEPDVIS